MDITVLFKLTYGLYVVGAYDGLRPVGCIINTCFQVTSQNPILAISMNKNNYTPQPIDTKDVVLPEELSELAEMIAKNVHEVWSEGRMKEGWTYGEKRDDARKHHPCLVPYEELTETEKEYDRNTSQETLKLIMKLGFKIVKE